MRENRMLDAMPRTPAQREAAEWWLEELRADLELAVTEEEVRAIVVRNARRVSPALLASAAFLAGITSLTEREEREGIGLLAKLAAAELSRSRAGS